MLIEAYRDSTHLAVIAVNTDASPVTQKFIIDGTTVDSLTPWVTSPSPDDSLAPKTPIAVTDDSFHLRPAGQQRRHLRELGRNDRDAGPDDHPRPGWRGPPS